jgi:transposase-like protein
MLFKNILTRLSQLPTEKKETLVEKLKVQIFEDKNTYRSKTEEYHRDSCPKCGAHHFIKYGFNKSLEQRYQCKTESCKTIFSDSTGSAIYRLQLKDKWYEYIDTMFNGGFYSTREMGKRINICHKTAFFWRHKVLFSISKRVTKLFGIVEVDDLHYSFNQKGRKNLNSPKKRGRQNNKQGDNSESVKVLATTDREGGMVLDVVRIGRLKASDVKKSIGGIINKETNILTSDNHPSLKSFAKAFKIQHETFLAKHHSRAKIYHVNTINEKAGRLKTLVNRRFKGIATKYLNNYCNWFTLIESLKQNSIDFFDESFRDHNSWGNFMKRENDYQVFLTNYSNLTG